MMERVCRVCHCTDTDCSQCIAKKGYPCRWVEQDLCSACLPVPTDLVEANQRFKATCGPMAFAALQGTNVADIMRFFPYFPLKTHTNGKHMETALQAAGYNFFWLIGEWPRDQRRRGVAWLQLDGPWMEAGLPIGAPLSRTHWVAYIGDMIFDPNAADWQPRDLWESTTLAAWVARTNHATGAYHPRKCYALHL